MEAGDFYTQGEFHKHGRICSVVPIILYKARHICRRIGQLETCLALELVEVLDGEKASHRLVRQGKNPLAKATSNKTQSKYVNRLPIVQSQTNACNKELNTASNK